mmetsp:Transcript_38157/g.75675  ORF Transcript_38157/g.75675 Transcript_38157/m.75675 type:complete len:514 (+) Transcript_38157:73-1614(+)
MVPPMITLQRVVLGVAALSTLMQPSCCQGDDMHQAKNQELPVQYDWLRWQQSREWDYNNQTNWAQLPGMCAHTNDQSPLDIRSTEFRTYPLEILSDAGDSGSSRIGPVTWNYTWPLVNVSLGWSERRSWEVKLLPPYDKTTTVTFAGVVFALQDVHFTSPSENRIEGDGFDMEAQHVHESADGKLLIISVMLRVGLVPDNPYLAQFWNDFPPYKHAGPAVTKIITSPFYGAFPEDRSFFVFKGSLTYPPCTNETTWVVFQEPVPISAKQRDSFRNLMNHTQDSRRFFRYAPGQIPPTGVIEPWDTTIGMNARHTQAPGERPVVKVRMRVDAGKPRASIVPRHFWVYVVLGLVCVLLLLGTSALAFVYMQHGRHVTSRSGSFVEARELPVVSMSQANSMDAEEDWRLVVDQKLEEAPRVQPHPRPPLLTPPTPPWPSGLPDLKSGLLPKAPQPMEQNRFHTPGTSSSLSHGLAKLPMRPPMPGGRPSPSMFGHAPLAGYPQSPAGSITSLNPRV